MPVLCYILSYIQLPLAITPLSYPNVACSIASLLLIVSVYIIYIPPPPPSHSASYNITSNHHHHHHRHHYNACIHYMHHCCREKTDHQCKLLWAWPNTSTLRTTTYVKEYMRTMVEDKDHQRKLQRVKNYTATIGVHDEASTCKLA